MKDCIIRGGENIYNIYPREIEEVLLEHSAVEEISVVGLPDAQWGEVVAAVVRLNPQVPRPSALDLYAYCRAKLADYKAPVRWFYVGEIPKTTSGKIQKFALKEQIAAEKIVAEKFQRPSSKSKL